MTEEKAGGGERQKKNMVLYKQMDKSKLLAAGNSVRFCTNRITETPNYGEGKRSFFAYLMIEKRIKKKGGLL